ncbi:MAG: hypothetical protein NC548_64020 [Lachnospiraceae bacterium]|nr:hypothetical protein [Lachnospiraceae bacterium]
MVKTSVRFFRAGLRIFRLSEDGRIGIDRRAARDFFCEKMAARIFPAAIIKQF